MTNVSRCIFWAKEGQYQNASPTLDMRISFEDLGADTCILALAASLQESNDREFAVYELKGGSPMGTDRRAFLKRSATVGLVLASGEILNAQKKPH